MAKPKTELVQRCPPPPYTRWDQRGKPVLLSFLKLINGKQLCLSLETDDPEIAKGHMRLLVAMLVDRGRLSPNGGAAEVYGRKGAGRSRLENMKTAKALSLTISPTLPRPREAHTTAQGARRMSLSFCPRFPEKIGRPASKNQPERARCCLTFPS
jgi:hypothetical protein